MGISGKSLTMGLIIFKAIVDSETSGLLDVSPTLFDFQCLHLLIQGDFGILNILWAKPCGVTSFAHFLGQLRG